MNMNRRRLRGFALTGVLCLTGVFLTPAFGQSNDRSPFIDSIPVGSTWQDVSDNEGNNLRIDFQTVAYSGGGTANGRTVVFGGGHNNGMNDAVAFLDWRNFETVGWTEELISTADLLGVSDNDYGAIGAHLRANFDGSTPGGVSDSRGLVALSRHTYDQIVVRDDHFYMFGGVLPFDNPGQGGSPWGEERGDIWRYDFGAGWSFVGAPLARGFTGQGNSAYDPLTGNIWVHDGTGLRLFNTTSETTGPVIDYLNSQAIESHLNFNSEKGAEGTLFGAGTYSGSNWWEYDIATGQQTNMGAVPGGSRFTYIIYVDSSFGPNYGTYFALVPQDGTLRRWNGSGWDTIATGAPRGDYVYGRGGFEPIHQVFYWVHNPYTSNNAWQTNVVRPYPFDGSVEPAPTVSLSASPTEVQAQGTTTLTWNANNATSCTASGNWSGSRPMSGSEAIGPLSTNSSFSLTCSGNGGTSADSVNVTVQSAPAAPVVSVSANPRTVDEGDNVVVEWSSSNADSCAASGGWTGSKSTSGNESIGPLTSDVTFTLTCSGAGGDASDSVSVAVTAAPSPPPPPSPPPSPPPPDGDAEASTGGGSVGWQLLALLGLAGLRRRTARSSVDA
ncbi:MAG: hypothetical protein QNJ14_09280 [Woeseiaceae bacterium]|nr:hypothetical protein [Woeseiaceae bacterium]